MIFAILAFVAVFVLIGSIGVLMFYREAALRPNQPSDQSAARQAEDAGRDFPADGVFNRQRGEEV